MNHFDWPITQPNKHFESSPKRNFILEDGVNPLWFTYIGQKMTTLGKASVVLLGTSWGNTSRTWGPCEDLKITDWEQKKKKIQYPHPPKRQNLEKFECMLYCLIAWAKFLFLHLFVNMFKQ
jgi:hypothetical protein